jgi:hypothetical protein
MAITAQDVANYLQSNPGLSDAQIAAAMGQYQVNPSLVAQATGLPIETIQQRYNAVAPTGQYSTSTTTGGTNVITPVQGSTSALPTSGASQIDPTIAPYLQEALGRARYLFLQGPQPEFFPGQTYVSPSQQTMSALQQQEALATGGSQALQGAQQAYQQALGGLGATAGGSFLQGSPYQQAAITAATRPITQQFENQVLPGISSMFSKAGRYGSGAMERATGQATEAYGRALGDVSSQMANQQYMAERQLQQQAQAGLGGLAQYGGQLYGQQLLPSQTLAQVGQAQEQIAAQPLQEQMNRYYFQQQVPYQQLSGYLSSIYGSPLGRIGAEPQVQTNQLASALGGASLGYLGGNILGSAFPSLGQNAGLYGAGAGALLGLL